MKEIRMNFALKMAAIFLQLAALSRDETSKRAAVCSAKAEITRYYDVKTSRV